MKRLSSHLLSHKLWFSRQKREPNSPEAPLSLSKSHFQVSDVEPQASIRIDLDVICFSVDLDLAHRPHDAPRGVSMASF
jgi:hypothetical protein